MKMRILFTALVLCLAVGCATTVNPERPLTFDAGADFSADSNPAHAWSYGCFERPEAEFHLYGTMSQKGVEGVVAWTRGDTDPNVYFNQRETNQQPDGTFTIEPRQLAFHPGPSGEYSVIRWTSPKAGRCKLSGAFAGLSGYSGAPGTTTDVAILHEARTVFSSSVNLNGKSNSSTFFLVLDVERGDSIDFTVGTGNNNYSYDSTALDAFIRLY